MDLVERYLAAIGRDLPQKTRADITAELRDELCSKIEEREAVLGRPLERKEIETLLVEFGHPLVVAGRYRGVQQLIGPQVFPFWWAWLRAVLAVIFGVYFVMGVLSVIGVGDSSVFSRAMPDLFDALVVTFGVVTLIFAGIERSGGVQKIARWSPVQLPAPNTKPRSRFEATVEAGMGMVFILWWVGVIRFQDVMPYPRPMELHLAPVWAEWFWPILGFAALQVVVDLLAMLRPGWVRLNAGLALARYLGTAAILAVIVRSGHFAEVGGLPWAEAAAIEHSLDLALSIGFSVTVAILLVKALGEAWRLARPGDDPMAWFKTARVSG